MCNLPQTVIGVGHYFHDFSQEPTGNGCRPIHETWDESAKKAYIRRFEEGAVPDLLHGGYLSLPQALFEVRLRLCTNL